MTYNDGQRDRTYPAVSWEVLIPTIHIIPEDITYVNVTGEGGPTLSWLKDDLLNGTGGGLAVNSNGEYVAVKEGAGPVVLVVVSIELG